MTLSDEVLLKQALEVPKDATPEVPVDLVEDMPRAPDKGTPSDGQASSSVTLANIFRHPDAHPIVLDMLLIKRYGPDWLSWEGETLQTLVPVDFHTQALSDLNLSKLQACRTLHAVDTYWQRWEVFGWCTMAFNEEFPDFELMQVPTVAQCLVSLDTASRIRGDMEFSLEVRHYLAAVYRHDGIFRVLPPSEFVTLDVIGIPVDFEALERHWPEVRSTGQVPDIDEVTAEQLHRLLVVNTYLEQSRARLQQQLPLVTHA